MDTIKILNIPNYYCGYYLKGLSQVGKLSYQPTAEFSPWNGMPFLIFEYKGKRVCIDNDDPMGVKQRIYDKVDFYFATNKLLDNPSYQQAKVHSLFPHYPINVLGLYAKTFGLKWLSIGAKNTIKEAYTLKRRPAYQNFQQEYLFKPYIFFAGSIWKKEAWANQTRADFIQACKTIPEIEFEGGMIPRTDGDNMGFDSVLAERRFSADEFSEKSAQSLVVFNNPAVLGAISWRVAECLNRGAFILSLPWQIELPIAPKHQEEIHMIENTDAVGEFLKYLVKNPDYHQKIAKGGKAYFENHCTPVSQAKFIISKIS